jgi:hypothetical protein
VEVEAFPRLDSQSCLRYDEAQVILDRGLPFRPVLCPDCPHKDYCDYNAQYLSAREAHHAVATQARGVVSMPDISKGRRYIFINEDPVGMLRPTFVTARGLLVVELVARQAEWTAHNAKDRGFFRDLGRLAKDLDGFHHGSNENASFPLPVPSTYKPKRLYKKLNEAIEQLGSKTRAEAMRLLLAAALAELSLLAVAVDEVPAKDNQTKIIRRLVAVSKTGLPPDAIVKINDATASREELENVLGQPIRDITPRGRLLLHHPALQVIPARDITMRTTPAQVVPILRGLLWDLPQKKVGVLTHQKLAKKLPDLLEEPFKSQIVMSEYFGSGLSRGSNRWHRECDVLLILGTPRVGSRAVREHLIKLGNFRAFGLNRDQAGWGWDCWSGVREDEKRVTVKTSHYRDWDWHYAYCSLVRSELIQAVGRGRGILPEGIPVYVVTTENLAPPDREDGINGLRIANHPFAPLTESQLAVLGTLRNERGIWLMRRTTDVARLLGLSRQRAGELLGELEKAKRVCRFGAWKWYLAERINQIKSEAAP